MRSVCYGDFMLRKYFHLRLDLVKVEQPEDYEKDLWQLDDGERLKLIPELKSQGNEYFKNKDYKQASELYAKAIGMLEQFMTR